MAFVRSKRNEEIIIIIFITIILWTVRQLNSVYTFRPKLEQCLGRIRAIGVCKSGLFILYSVVFLGGHCLREVRRFDGSLDDSSVDSQDGQDDTGQKDQGQLVDILYANKYHRGHGGQQDGPIHTHVVKQGGLCFGTFQALQGEDGRFGHYVDLKQRI